jgi:hypothetical protein
MGPPSVTYCTYTYLSRKGSAPVVTCPVTHISPRASLGEVRPVCDLFIERHQSYRTSVGKDLILSMTCLATDIRPTGPVRERLGFCLGTVDIYKDICPRGQPVESPDPVYDLSINRHQSNRTSPGKVLLLSVTCLLPHQSRRTNPGTGMLLSMTCILTYCTLVLQDQ